MPTPSLARKRVVVLPDLFVDAMVRLPPWDRVAPAMRRIVARGGGNLPVGPVDIRVGGNAANTALALARLGARVHLVAETDPLGRHLLEQAAQGTRLDLEHVAVGAQRSTTLALETGDANLMLSHGGPLRAFGPSRVGAAAWQDVEAADAVVVTNWSQNRKGTALLSAVAQRLRDRPAFLLVDTGDLRHRDDVAGLLRARRVWSRVDAWALNENELRAATGDGSDLPALAAGLAQRLGCRVDLHTRGWALSVGRGARVRLASPVARPRRLTGAGDAWNAGNVAAQLLGLPDRARLRVAHAVAHAYVTSDAGEAPDARALGRIVNHARRLA